MPTPEEHALLSASSSSRWLVCTKAPRLEEQFPESTSEYAEAGRVAHSIAELKARRYFVEPMSTRAFNSRLKKLQEDPHFDKGMNDATDTYLEYLKGLAMTFGSAQPFVALENRVDYSEYAPEAFGTTDCIMIACGVLCVVDYKNGSGVAVSAEENSQMMLYALGALKVYAPIFGNSIQRIHLGIVQPNAGGVKEWECSREELEQWAETVVKAAAKLAWAGEGEFAPAESRCKFCRAKAKCSARAAKMLELESYQGGLPQGKPGAAEKSPGPLLTDAEVGDVLTRALGLEAWVSDLKEYAQSTVLSGGTIPGFKLVEGRGSREWSDMDNAFTVLTDQGVSEAMLWERKPVTPPALEKTMGKKTFAELAEDLVLKKPGKPGLVPESDPRKPYNAAEIAFGGAANG
jgi:hypothetical protein